MSRFEVRYRAMLRVLPGWYRSAREEEMVASALAGTDDVDREDSWPR